jgi:hypothetical protein
MLMGIITSPANYARSTYKNTARQLALGETATSQTLSRRPRVSRA